MGFGPRFSPFVAGPWLDMTASRVEATQYTNNSGYPLYVMVIVTATLVGVAMVSLIRIHGSPDLDLAKVTSTAVAVGANTQQAVQAIIPAGAIYSQQNANGDITQWFEAKVA